MWYVCTSFDEKYNSWFMDLHLFVIGLNVIHRDYLRTAFKNGVNVRVHSLKDRRYSARRHTKGREIMREWMNGVLELVFLIHSMRWNHGNRGWIQYMFASFEIIYRWTILSRECNVRCHSLRSEIVTGRDPWEVVLKWIDECKGMKKFH